MARLLTLLTAVILLGSLVYLVSAAVEQRQGFEARLAALTLGIEVRSAIFHKQACRGPLAEKLLAWDHSGELALEAADLELPPRPGLKLSLRPGTFDLGLRQLYPHAEMFWLKSELQPPGHQTAADQLPVILTFEADHPRRLLSCQAGQYVLRFEEDARILRYAGCTPRPPAPHHGPMDCQPGFFITHEIYPQRWSCCPLPN